MATKGIYLTEVLKVNFVNHRMFAKNIFEHNILQKFDNKISKIRSIMGKKFNIYRLKLFEAEALIYINSLYKDLDNAISNGKTPSP